MRSYVGANNMLQGFAIPMITVTRFLPMRSMCVLTRTILVCVCASIRF